MTQIIFTDIVATSKSGSQLATDLNNFKASLLSTSKGATAPSYAVAGTTWVNDSADPLWSLTFFDGTDHIVLSEIDTSANTQILKNVKNGAALTDGANVNQIQQSRFIYLGVAGGTADALTVTATPTITSLQKGSFYIFQATSANTTTTPTLKVDGTAAAVIELKGGTIPAGTIGVNDMVMVMWNGSKFQMCSPGAAVKAIANLDIGNGLESDSGALRIKLDGSTLSRSSSGMKLSDTAVTAGSYTNADITVDAQGRITAASSGASPEPQVTASTDNANIILRKDDEQTQNSTSHLTKATFNMGQGGSVNIYFQHKSDSPFEVTSIIRKNGSTVKSWTTSSGSYVGRNHSFSVSAGDEVTVTLRSHSGQSVEIRNIRVRATGLDPFWSVS